jgi:hypothetical protein
VRLDIASDAKSLFSAVFREPHTTTDAEAPVEVQICSVFGHGWPNGQASDWPVNDPATPDR